MHIAVIAGVYRDMHSLSLSSLCSYYAFAQSVIVAARNILISVCLAALLKQSV